MSYPATQDTALAKTDGSSSADTTATAILHAAEVNGLSAAVVALEGAPLGCKPTAVKTSAYSAAAGDFVLVDTTAGVVPITLPTAPFDGAVVGIKMVTQGGTNAVTFACGGSDVFNKTGGGTSGSLAFLNQAIIMQYRATGAYWVVMGDDLPLSQLDARYTTPSAASGVAAGLALIFGA